MKKIIFLFKIAILNSLFPFITHSQNNYIPGSVLLDKGGDIGEVAWGQTKNNTVGCTPSYNQYCPSGNEESKCWHKPTGCGPVAVGQVMWYWQWPPRSAFYRAYNWHLMPAELKEGDIAEGNEIAYLLSDLGDAMQTHYSDTGSGTIDHNMPTGFARFHYASRMRQKSSWGAYGTAWIDLIRSEIKAERPVVYSGGPDAFSGHIFIIDGYSTANPDLFHINFGWKGGSNDFFTLNNIIPPGHNYNKDQYAVFGISPIYPNSSNQNIFDVSFSSVSNTRTETARQNITLPASGKTITVENGGNLTLIAGNSISLKSGFHAKAGSNFTAKIDPIYKVDKEVRLINYSQVVRPKYQDGTKYFWIETENADSWEFELFDRQNNGKQIWATAGSIENYRTNVWDGINSTDQLRSTDYWFVLTLKNSYGRIEEFAGHFTLLLSVPDCNEGINVIFTPLNTVANDGGLLLTPNGDGVNDEVCFNVENVARWEATLLDRSYRSLYRDGDATGQSSICVTDGRGFPNGDRYLLQINYKGINGCLKSKDYYVYILGSTITRLAEAMENDSLLLQEQIFPKSDVLDSLDEVIFGQNLPISFFLDQNEGSVSLRSAIADDILKKTIADDLFLQKEKFQINALTDLSEEAIPDNNLAIFLFPNPSKGTVFVRSTNHNTKNVRVYNALGILVFQAKDSDQLQTEIDLSLFPDGIYTFLIEVNGKLSTHKILLSKQ